jgi:3-methyladenine DNA glycosylase AlkD
MTDKKQTTAAAILRTLHAAADSEKAALLPRFFKTGKGEYGEGDVFLGIVMPALRKIVKAIAPSSIGFEEIQKLLESRYHEARMAALLLLVAQFEGKGANLNAIFEFYLRNARCANNWDLVDASCREIVGAFLLDKTDRSVLYTIADSENLWEQRIAIVSTGAFIKHGQFEDTFALAEKFFSHPHDLIHKATGWMLREVGKKDRERLRAFLEKHRQELPRTALRYAIEHFTKAEQRVFLRGE